jgi:tetratricopeptide (TPR) repeat protein
MSPSALIRQWLLVIALVMAGAHVAAAQAQAPADGPPTAKSVAQLNEEGALFYQQRDYRHAIERFIQAYAMDPDPNLLFNIARSYERLGEVDAAIEKYEAFIKTPGADAGGRGRAEESLRALRESKANAGAGRPGSAAASQSSDRAPEPATPQPERGAPSRSIVPWLALGGGVAFTTVGVTLYLLGVSDHNKVTDANGYGEPSGVLPLTRKEAEDLVSSGDSKKLIGGIGMGVGGALLATYVVLLVSGDSPSSERAALSIAPEHGGGSMSLSGRF